MRAWKKLLSDAAGEVSIEYCIIAGIISIAIVFGATAIGLAVKGDFGAVVAALP